MTSDHLTPDSEPLQRARRYGGTAPGPAATVVTVHLRADAAEAVLAIASLHNLSRSGAAHYLIRLGAGLPPLPPLN
jgi:hypothetical protein